MAINYQPTTWNNEQEPAISADNLNHIEQGIKSIADRVDELVTVEANPSSSATDRLTGLEVDGTTYEVGGGHKVYTDGGTLLPQQPNMVVKGVYSKDNATNNITEIEVVREFQSDAEVQALTGEEAKGFQHTPDNVYRARAAADITFDPTNTLLTQTRMQEAMEELDAAHLPYSSTQNVKQKIDSLDASSWISVDVTGKSKKIWLRKINKIVEFWYWTDEDLTGDIDIATIPAGYRPSVPFYPYYILVKDLQKDSPIFRLTIDGNGKVHSGASGSSGWIYFHNFWTTP